MSETETFSYTLSRTVDVPAKAVWDAWTTPDQYAQWANAVPESVRLDVHPGGAWQATMIAPDGTQFPLTGSYVEVVDHERLVVGMDVPGRPEPALMEMRLEADGDKTCVTLYQACDTAQEREMAEAGSTMLLDGLVTFLSAS